MSFVLWHGYLLGGTGSNVYTRSLARAWSRMGREVVVLCQEPHPERYDVGTARVIRPEAGTTLPVFVLDRYADMTPRLIQDMDQAGLDQFVAANADAIRQHLPCDLLLTNHLLLGGPVGAGSGAPYIVKAHGSELEFSMRGNERLCAWARDTLSSARAILAGTPHIRDVIADVLGPGPHLDRVRIVPPGVDVEAFRPAGYARAVEGLVGEFERDPPNPKGDERLPDPGNAARLRSFLAGERPTVVYVGKLSREKGVHLLLDALATVDARAILAGFGPERHAAEARAEAEGLDILFTGGLEHRHLVHLFAMASVAVTPSVFPEAFGMVAAEAAACGTPALVAFHSGLAEVARGLREEYPAERAHLASFESGSAGALASRLREILALGPADRRALGEAARRAAVRLWSWESVAARIASLAAGSAVG